METKINKLLVSILSASLLALPTELLAKERRGAELLVTRIGGSQLSGELIAVKPDSLLLLTEGRDEAVDQEVIRSIRIVKGSRTGGFSGVGALIGLAGGATLGWAMAADMGGKKASAALMLGFLGGLGGALSGLLVGTAFDAVDDADSTFTFKDKSAEAIAEYWKTLERYSRVGRQKKRFPVP